MVRIPPALGMIGGVIDHTQVACRVKGHAGGQGRPYSTDTRRCIGYRPILRQRRSQVDFDPVPLGRRGLTLGVTRRIPHATAVIDDKGDTWPASGVEGDVRVRAVVRTHPQVQPLPLGRIKAILVARSVVELQTTVILLGFRIEGDARPILGIQRDVPTGIGTLAARPKRHTLPVVGIGTSLVTA